MNPRGRVWLWHRDLTRTCGGFVTPEIVPLLRLDAASLHPLSTQLSPGSPELSPGLRGRFVRVRNAGALPVPSEGGELRAQAFGDALPDENGDYLFEHQRGGGRVEKFTVRSAKYRLRYEEASRYGEVNAYFHTDLIAAYLDEVLRGLSAPPLPMVTVLVNAHHAATEREHGVRDGVRRGARWVPFQGGHYRLPGACFKIYEHDAIEETGEIHLGPGWKLLTHGALVEATGKRYRANASHNAPIIYHEYGHHLTRHTADFRANALKDPQRQNNLKTAMDEGICDYFTAVMLGGPHIWAWHRQHDEEAVHERSLSSALTMADFDASPQADPHFNGTIWASALWEMRCALAAQSEDGGRIADEIVVQSLLLLGRAMGAEDSLSLHSIRRAREGFEAGLAALLLADDKLNAGANSHIITDVFASRGIAPVELVLAQAGEIEALSRALEAREIEEDSETNAGERDSAASPVQALPSVEEVRELLSRHNAPEDIPASQDIVSGEELRAYLKSKIEPPLSVIVTGDTMLGGRTRPLLAEHGRDYVFAGVNPLLQRAPIVVGNLEGPFARQAPKEEREKRNYQYRVNPRLAGVLQKAGFNVMTLANNHLHDCGPQGVLETLAALDAVGIAPLGAGVNEEFAHAPVILPAGELKIGLLSYYWHWRTAAGAKMPGSALDSPENIRRDIEVLRGRADRIVVIFHWGVPYEREPAQSEREKAYLAIDCGADAVVSHHPHIVQPFEVYQGRPIFYSVGNFAFGSGNSRGEGLLVGLRFETARTVAYAYPIYVKNRDPRLNYQPKTLRGAAAAHVLGRMKSISGTHGAAMRLEDYRAVIELPYAPLVAERLENAEVEAEALCL